jgi:hypothetical protein
MANATFKRALKEEKSAVTGTAVFALSAGKYVRVAANDPSSDNRQRLSAWAR